jgi:predicted site-specific integrase-resolvase
MSEIYLTISEAAKRINKPEGLLHQLAQVDKIRWIKTSTGEILVNEDDMESLQKEMFSELSGKPISIVAASRKYNIPHQTISRWKDKNYIRVIYTDGQKVFLDEADVARQVQNYLLNPGTGRWTVKKINNKK